MYCSQSLTRRFLITAPKMAFPLPPGSSPFFTDSCIEITGSNLVPCWQYLGTNYIENTDFLLLRSCLLLWERVHGAVVQKRSWFIRPSRGLCTVTALHVIILTKKHIDGTLRLARFPRGDDWYCKRFLTFLLFLIVHVRRMGWEQSNLLSNWRRWISRWSQPRRNTRQQQLLEDHCSS